MRNFLEFNQIIGKLKHMPRTGWVKRGVPNPETVASHSWRVAMMILQHSDEVKAFGADVDRAVKMSLYHDVGESVIGDIMPGQMSREEKLTRERKAVNELSAKFDMKEIYELWHEMEEQKTPTAIIVKDFDVVDMLMQAFEYIKENPRITSLQEFMQRNETSVQTDIGKCLVSEIKMTQVAFNARFKSLCDINTSEMRL